MNYANNLAKKVKFHPNRTTMCTTFQRTLYIAINNNNKYFNFNYETLKTMVVCATGPSPHYRTVSETLSSRYRAIIEPLSSHSRELNRFYISGPPTDANEARPVGRVEASGALMNAKFCGAFSQCDRLPNTTSSHSRIILHPIYTMYISRDFPSSS